VIAVGTGIVLKDGKTIPLQVKPGDRVLFSKYGGTEVKFVDEDYLVMREDDILGILE
jgi:chaperonin GroES